MEMEVDSSDRNAHEMLSSSTSSDTDEMDATDETEADQQNDSSPDDKPKWTSLNHSGPAFAPAYQRLPNHVLFKYDGQPITLSERAEEMAFAYAKLLRRKIASEKEFKTNFFSDWRCAMTSEEKAVIVDIGKCNFKSMYYHFSKHKTRNESVSNNQQDLLKKIEHRSCTIDGEPTEIDNYNMEPPGFLMSKSSRKGKWKKRIQPEDVIINCSVGCDPAPPAGHEWKDIVHNHHVSWLAKWDDPVTGNPKYIRLSPSAKLKGEEDRHKYDTAAELGKHIEDIRTRYRKEWQSETEDTRQLAIAIYLIDTFAFRAGGDHDDPDDADTVGCCSLRVRHVKLHEKLRGEEKVVEFDFVGKASIQYKNSQKIEHDAFECLKLLTSGKEPDDPIFDQLSTDKVNRYLKKIMDNLTTKVFRTFRASAMLEAELRKTDHDMHEKEKLLVFHGANLKVAKLCNHRRTPSTIQLEEAIFEKQQEIDQFRKEIQLAENILLKQMKESRQFFLIQEKDKLEKKFIKKMQTKLPATGTSKEHYIDPRMVVAWCLKFNVPTDKVYTTALLRRKFRWAIENGDQNYTFYPYRHTNANEDSEAGCSYWF